MEKCVTGHGDTHCSMLTAKGTTHRIVHVELLDQTNQSHQASPAQCNFLLGPCVLHAMCGRCADKNPQVSGYDGDHMLKSCRCGCC